MFLVLTAVLFVLMTIATYAVAYRLANPQAEVSYSKLVGWLAGMGGLPFLGGATYFAYRAGGEGLSVAVLMVGIVVMAIASVRGELQGLKQPTT